jgi:hypothetical protein
VVDATRDVVVSCETLSGTTVSDDVVDAGLQAASARARATPAVNLIMSGTIPLN